ncbi:thioesterase II family protein [Nitrospirillum bahiense]|uniref:Medium-chain acyl-[acyl-carrier-protein] hydrolase n=1 Tax=Nitrospirillum amazonense TaxID=28077 RepID=A0A560EU89_9PROT|nr:alpha/beta fold hydrolase [Nitrospirillum amazonense]TWB12894.1 medium-chain acyl-[acyl-carrier-protein] hydrolase [Nitrospirillum amazonense]
MSWLHPLIRGTNPIGTIVAFPYGGGGLNALNFLAKGVPPGLDVWGVLLPGRPGRWQEPAATRMDQVVPPIVATLKALPRRPLVLAGHSLGAAIAHAVAEALTREGRPPLGLVVSGRRAPHLPPNRPPVWELDDAGLDQELRHLGGTPPEVLADRDLMDLMRPLLRADFTLSDSYRVAAPAPLPLDLVALAGDADTTVTVDEVAAWETVQAHSFQRQTMKGGHFFIQENPDDYVRLIHSLFLKNALAASSTGEPLS